MEIMNGINALCKDITLRKIDLRLFGLQMGKEKRYPE